MRAALYTRTKPDTAVNDVRALTHAAAGRGDEIVAVFNDTPRAFAELEVLVEADGVEVVYVLGLYHLVHWREAAALVRAWRERGVDIVHLSIGRPSAISDMFDWERTAQTPREQRAAAAMIDISLARLAHFRVGGDPVFDRYCFQALQQGLSLVP